MAVVDGEGRVHGIRRLRVVDASIMPDVVTAKPNATVLMMAEKIAGHINGEARCPQSWCGFTTAVAEQDREKHKRGL